MPGFPQRRNVARTTALFLTLSLKRGLSLCFFMTDGRRNDQVIEERAATVNTEMRREGQASPVLFCQETFYQMVSASV